MKGDEKMKERLINELSKIRLQLAELEKSEIERKQAEEALRESEEKYRLVVENAGEAITIIQDEMMKFVNPQLVDILGYSVEELTSKPFIEFIYPEDRQMVLERYMKRMNNENVPSAYPLRSVTKTGTVKWAEIHATIVSWNGKPATLIFMTDITDRKRAEEAFRASELKYQTIFENTGTTMLIVEEDMTISLANDGFENLTGYKRKEVEGKKKWTEFVEKGDLEKMITQHKLRRADSGLATKSYEFKLIHSDGHFKDILLTVDVIPGTKRSVASLMDITDRKRAEAALKESEEKYRNILENINDAYFEVDLRGNLTFCNTVLPRFLEYTQEEVVGMNYRVYMDSKTGKLIMEHFNELYMGDIPAKVINFEIIKKDGTKAEVEASFSLRKNEDGHPIGFRGIVRDISERKKAERERRALEERLQRAEKMEAIGTLAGGVAHDLNNVLGVLVGYSELILYKIDESSAIRPHIINIMKGGERAAAIVQDLLTLARRGVRTEKVINLNTIIIEYQKSPEFEKLCKFHPGVQIKTHLATDLLNIMGSPVHLGKTLFNLVSNAAEAMPNGGEVSITTTNQYLDRPIQGYDNVREGDYVVLSVSDRGEGIKSADLKRIFEPFYTKKTMGRSGTGLGLAVVWGTVRDHSGYIDVRSEEGKGTTFTLYFPVTRKEVSEDQRSVSVSEYMGNGESILVVDDVEEQRELASQMLRKLNYTTATVSSGEKAVEYVKGQPVDLIVLDMIMDPGIDGLDTYRKILKINPKQKSIIVSGFAETDRVHQAQVLGAGVYIRKPYVLERLGLAVRKELDRR